MGAGILSSSLSAKSFGPELQGLMSTAAVHDVFEVIVTFEGEGAINTERLNIIESAGVIGGVSFKQLLVLPQQKRKSNKYILQIKCVLFGITRHFH